MFPRDHGAHPDLAPSGGTSPATRSGGRARLRLPGDVLSLARGRHAGHAVAASPPSSWCSRMRPSPTCTGASCGTTSASRARASASRWRPRPTTRRAAARLVAATRSGDGYAAHMRRPAASRSTLRFAPTQPVLLQGAPASRARARGPGRPATTTASRNWPRAAALLLQGALRRRQGTAWLDHEWSEELLAPRGGGLGLDRHEP